MIARARRIAAASLLAATAWLAPIAPASADVVERVVATVNDRAVLLSELRRRAAPYLEHAISGARTAAERKARIQDLYSQLIYQLIDEELVEQTARKMQITVAMLEVDQAIENVRQQSQLAEAQFWEAVQNQGFTPKQYREDVRKQLLRLKVINQRVRSRVNITDQTVRETYDERARQARRAQRFRAAHVFLPLPEDASATDVARVTAEAQAIAARLTPETFEATTQTVGGGDLGWLDQGDLPAVLEETLLGLEEGELSGPVRGPAGVHIFMLRERQAGKDSLPAFEDMRAQLQRELLDRAMQRQEELFLKGLRRDAVIVTRL